MFCLTFFYLPFFSIKALCEEMLSSCLPRASLPHPFPVKRSYWHARSISSLPNRSAIQSHGHWLSLFGPAKSWWKEEGWLQSVYTGSPLPDWQQSHSNAPGEAQGGASLDVEQGNSTKTLQLKLLRLTPHSDTPGKGSNPPQTWVIFINY